MTATLPARHETRTRRLQGPMLLAGGVLAASLLLHLRNPHQGGSYAYCPGCGGLRAVNDLTNGDLAAAASSNLLFVVSLPVLVLWWASTVRDRWRGRVRQVAARRHGMLAVAFLMVALAFAVVRNLPFGAWLAP